MRKARDLMTSHPRCLGSGDTLRDAVDFFTKNDVYSAPVVSPLGELLGVLTEMGMVRAALKQYLTTTQSPKLAQHLELLEAASTVHEDDDLGLVFKAMIKSPNHRIAVQNTQGRLVGVISPRDVLFYLAGENQKAISLRAQLDQATSQIGELKNQLQDAQKISEKFHSLFLDTPYMMHSVNESGMIVLANKKIHEVLGYEPGELIGKSLADLYPESVRHEAIQGLQDIMARGFHHTTYTTLLHKTGKKIRADIASTALCDKYGKFISTITICREVDSEALLRALNGIVDTENLDPAAKIIGSAD